MDLIDPAASEIQRIRHDHHIFERTGAVRHIIPIVSLVRDKDQDRCIVMENVLSALRRSDGIRY